MKTKRKDPLQGQNSVYNTFVNNLYNQTSTHVAWNISLLILATFNGLLTTWNDAWGISQNKTACTSADRETTRQARAALTAFLRPFIQAQIYLNTDMTPADITLCGLQPRDKTRTRVGKPDSEPSADFKIVGTHSIAAFVHQSPLEKGVSKRAKPAGVMMAKVAYHIGDNPPADPKDFNRQITGTRSPIKIDFNPIDAGKRIALAACWISTSNIEGDYDDVQVMNIP